MSKCRPAQRENRHRLSFAVLAWVLVGCTSTASVAVDGGECRVSCSDSGVDGAQPDAGRQDATPDAPPVCEECENDDNPCTRAVCLDGECVQSPDSQEGTSCGDDVFCNGSEVCRGGECVAENIPCPGDCDVEEDRCQCTTDNESTVCVLGPSIWTRCSFEQPTDCEGTQQRLLRSGGRCEDSECVYDEEIEERACTRLPTDETACREDEVSSCSATSGQCLGARSRTVFRCEGAQCVGGEMTETCPASAGGACDDGAECTTGDVCDGKGQCIGTPNDAECDDGDDCTVDFCRPGGCVQETAPDDTICGFQASGLCCDGVCGAGC